jgi:hypothetical protein
MARTFIYLLSLFVVTLSHIGAFAMDDGTEETNRPNKRPFSTMEQGYEVTENSRPKKIRKSNSSPAPVRVTSIAEIIEFFREPNGMDLVELCKNNTTYLMDVDPTNCLTVLHYAAAFGHIDVVKYLCEQIPSMIYCKDNVGSTALHTACQYGQLEVVKYFCVNFDHLPHVVDASNFSAIYLAVAHGHINIIDYLCRTRPWVIDDEHLTGGYSVIHHAVENNQLKAVVYFCHNHPRLIGRVAHITGTILHLSGLKKHTNILNYLCKNHPYLKDIHFTPEYSVLHQAVGFDQLDIILLLVPHFPEILTIGRQAQVSPLEMAISLKKLQAAVLLSQLEIIYTHGWAGNKDIQDMATISLPNLLALQPEILDYVLQQHPCHQKRINHLISSIESFENALKAEHEIEKNAGDREKAEEHLNTLKKLNIYKDIYHKYRMPNLKTTILSTMTNGVQRHDVGILQARAYQQFFESMKTDQGFMDTWESCLPWARMNTETPEEFLNILQPFPKEPDPVHEIISPDFPIELNWDDDIFFPNPPVWEDNDLFFPALSIEQKAEGDNWFDETIDHVFGNNNLFD